MANSRNLNGYRVRWLLIVFGLFLTLLTIFIFRHSWLDREKFTAIIGEPSATAGKLPTLAGDPSVQKLVLVSVPDLSFLELQPEKLKTLPHFQFLSERGRWAAMNIRTPGRGMVSLYASMGASAPVHGSAAGNAFMRNETIKGAAGQELYARYQFRKPPTDGAILLPEFLAVQEKESTLRYGAQIGLLGQTLEDAGVERFVYGNADFGQYLNIDREEPASQGDDVSEFFNNGKNGMDNGNNGMVERDHWIGELVTKRQRYASWLLTDAQGVVPNGDVSGSELLADPIRSGGVRTNYKWLLDKWKETPDRSVTLIELGDLHRLYQDKDGYGSQAFLNSKKQILEEMDRFLGEILNMMDERAELWLFSPKVNRDAAAEKWLLAPLVAYAPNTPAGLLYSPTTRRAGVVTYADAAPTWLRHLGLDIPRGMTGFALQTLSTDYSLEEFFGELKRMSTVYQIRPRLLYPYVTYEMTVLLLSAMFVLLGGFERKNGTEGKRGAHFFVYGIRLLLYSILAVPLVLFFMGWLGNDSKTLVFLQFFGGTLALSVLLNRRPWLWIAAMFSFLTGLLILADGFTGALAMKRSILGYDAMVGARYYGIGNEYMGVLIGSLIFGLSGMLEKIREWCPPRVHRGRSSDRPVRYVKPLAVIVSAVTTLYLAWPTLGTNAGGALTATVAFGIFLYRIYAENEAGLRTAAAPADMHKNGMARSSSIVKRRPVAGWGILLLFVMGLLLLGLAFLWLCNRPFDSQPDRLSHIGRAMQAVGEGRWDLILGMMTRKLAMNWHLFKVSVWSKVFVTCLVIIAILVTLPYGIFRTWRQRVPYIMHGFAANTAGAAVALLFNDSGIVAAGTMIAYVVVPMLLLKLQERRLSHSS